MGIARESGDEEEELEFKFAPSRAHRPTYLTGIAFPGGAKYWTHSKRAPVVERARDRGRSGVESGQRAVATKGVSRRV